MHKNGILAIYIYTDEIKKTCSAVKKTCIACVCVWLAIHIDTYLAPNLISLVLFLIATACETVVYKYTYLKKYNNYHQGFK